MNSNLIMCNRFMFSKTKNKGKKIFCKNCLQCSVVKKF